MQARFLVLAYPKFVMVQRKTTYRVFPRTRPPLEAIVEFVDSSHRLTKEYTWTDLNNPMAAAVALPFYFHPLLRPLDLIDQHVVSVEEPEHSHRKAAMVEATPRPMEWDDEEDGEWQAAMVPSRVPWYMDFAFGWNMVVVLSLPCYFLIAVSGWKLACRLGGCSLPAQRIRSGGGSEELREELEAERGVLGEEKYAAALLDTSSGGIFKKKRV